MRRVNVLVAATLAALIAAPVNAAVDVKPYGFVSAVYNESFNRGNRIDNPNVALSPNAAAPNNGTFSDFDTRGTRLGMKLSGGKGPMDADLSGVIEMDFNGAPVAATPQGSTQMMPRLRLAYVQAVKGIHTFTFGQDWDNAFIPVNPVSTVRIAQGLGTSAGRIYNRLPQLRWDADWLKGGDTGVTTRLAAVRSFSGDELAGTGTQPGTGDRSGWPMFQANVELKQKVADQTFRVSVAGQYRRNKFSTSDTIPAGATSFVADNLLGAVYFVLPLHSMFEIDGSGYYGRGENSSIGGLSKFINDQGTIRDAQARGGWAQAVLKPMAGWRVLAFYGVADVSSAAEAVASTHRNEELMGSVIWDVSPELALSVEGGHVHTMFEGSGTTTTAGTAPGKFDSIGAGAQYKF